MGSIAKDTKGAAIADDELLRAALIDCWNEVAIRDSYLGDEVTRTIMQVASRPPPTKGHYPHVTNAGGVLYQYEPPEWWTAGFFPGSIWLLYQRSLKRQLSAKSDEILRWALHWQQGLEAQQHNSTTHDLGFMIMPSFCRDYELRGSSSSKEIIIQAGRSLSSRWSEKVQCLRSWDQSVSKRFNFVDASVDFLVIIDNMMNLDLLYVTSHLTGDAEFARRATAHARKTLKYHIRHDNSTYHLVNYDPETGVPKGFYTVQGYADDSCWSRGQAWALYGFAVAYKYTRDAEFLLAAVRLAEYFCSRVPGDGAVYWDFDAPQSPALLDTSAAMIACSGMLLICQLAGNRQFVSTVAKIMAHCARHARTGAGYDSLLDHATVNNNKDAINPVRDTGLVYADYYFLEVGNRLIDLGFI